MVEVAEMTVAVMSIGMMITMVMVSMESMAKVITFFCHQVFLLSSGKMLVELAGGTEIVAEGKAQEEDEEVDDTKHFTGV